MSFPLRERGLKLLYQDHASLPVTVVPLAGTWIETHTHAFLITPVPVVPLAGTWIETIKRRFPTAVANRRSPCGNVD